MSVVVKRIMSPPPPPTFELTIDARTAEVLVCLIGGVGYAEDKRGESPLQELYDALNKAVGHGRTKSFCDYFERNAAYGVRFKRGLK